MKKLFLLGLSFIFFVSLLPAQVIKIQSSEAKVLDNTLKIFNTTYFIGNTTITIDYEKRLVTISSIEKDDSKSNIVTFKILSSTTYDDPMFGKTHSINVTSNDSQEVVSIEFAPVHTNYIYLKLKDRLITFSGLTKL